MSDKGNAYHCTWEKTAAGLYVGWEKRHPHLRAEAATPDELVPALGNVVGEYHNDHEAALDFDPPLPSAHGYDRLFVDQIIQAAWNNSYTFRPSANEAFVGGRCKRCRAGQGQRSSTPLVVDSIWPGADGSSSWMSDTPTSPGMPGRLTICSEAFLHLLTDQERATFEARPVQWTSPRRRLKFFELIPKAILPIVAIKGIQADGWRCDGCGRRRFSNGTALGWGIQVICRSDLPSPLPPCFFIGDPAHNELCMSRARWRELCGKPGTRKLMQYPLAIIEEKNCNRQPRLQVPREQ